MSGTNEAPAILLKQDFLADSDQLFTQLLENVNWDESMSARKTASFGKPYDYSQMAYAASEMHPDLLAVVDQLEAALGIRFNNCLLNYYETGNNTMGFHSDEIEHLQEGTGVAIVSLGSTREITFRSTEDHDNRHRFELTSGSLLYMDQQIQRDWMHAIRKQPGAGPRISLTWRAIQ